MGRVFKARLWALASLLATVTFLPTPVEAALDHWQTPVSNVAGIITAGEINVYLQHPDGFYGRVGDQYHMSALLTAPSATNPVVTWSISHTHGCTGSNPSTNTTSTGIGVVSSFDFDVSTSGTTCAIGLTVLITAGALNTQIYKQLLTSVSPSSDHTCGSPVIDLDKRACGASEFQVLTGLQGWEFLALLGLLLLALIIWSRSTDYLLKFSMGILLFAPVIVFTYLLVRTAWLGHLFLAVFFGALGGYLIVRAGIDKFTESKGAT